jgi:glutaredoxin
MYQIHNYVRIHDLASCIGAGHGGLVNAPDATHTAPALLRFARALGLARGLLRDGRVGPRPQRTLELYSMEGCGACRRVREVLTELDIDYMHRSCPKGDSANRRRLEERGGKAQLPYLVDPNFELESYDSAKIIEHLIAQYG